MRPVTGVPSAAAAALMIQAGYPPKMLQEILGHAGITTTLDLHGHLYPGDMDKYADRLDDAATDAGKAKIRPRRRRRRPGEIMSGPSSCENMSALGGTRTPNLQIRRFPYGHPDPFRSVRYLGLAAARCSHPSGELRARSTVWLPAWLPAAGHKSPLVLVLGRSSLDGSARPRTATKSATYGQLPAHLLRRAHLQSYATLARVVFSLIAPRPQSLLHDVSKHRAARDHPRHIPQTGRKVQGDRSDVYVRPATTKAHTR